MMKEIDHWMLKQIFYIINFLDTKVNAAEVNKAKLLYTPLQFFFTKFKIIYRYNGIDKHNMQSGRDRKIL